MTRVSPAGAEGLSSSYPGVARSVGTNNRKGNAVYQRALRPELQVKTLVASLQGTRALWLLPDCSPPPLGPPP